MRRAITLVLLFMFACSQSPTQAPATTTTAAPNAPRVIFPDGYSVTVEIAANDETRAQGLMFRDQLAADKGMIFLFPQTGTYPFWMKNTLIPLDMVWIDENKRVVSASYGVPPCKADPCPSYPPAGPARYVLEVASGIAKSHNITAGSQLRFEGLDDVMVR